MYLRFIFSAIFLIHSPCAMSAIENDALVVFDTMCVSTDADIEVVVKMASASKAKPIPKSVLDLDQAMARNGGFGYVMKFNENKFILMVTPKKSCSVIVQNASPANMKNILLSNYPLIKYREDSSGTQVMTMYKMMPPSEQKGGVIIFNATKSGFGADNSISLGFIAVNHQR
jgi:hypothetical protein